MVAGQGAGIVEYGPRVCLHELLNQAIDAALWRQIQDFREQAGEYLVAIVCSSLQQVQRAHRRLRREAWQLRLIAGELFPEEVFDVVVCTWPGLRLLRRYPQHIHTCLVLEPTRLLGPENLAALPEACRIFGFVRQGQALAPSERDDLTSLLAARSNRIAGLSPEAADDLWLTIPRHGHVCRPVSVLRQQITAGSQVDDTDPVAFKQRAIWHAPHRNRQVASLAKRIVARRELPANLLASLEGGAAPLLVVVESLDHAAALQVHHLRSWPVLCLEGCNTAGLPANTRLHPIPKEPHVLQGPAIATFAALPYLEQLDVVLRADGGMDELPLSVEVLSCPLDSPQPLLVIDVADRTPPLLRCNARRREQTYRQQHWDVKNLHPQQK